MQSIFSFIDANRQRFLYELFDLLRIPSISSSTVHTSDVQTCATWLGEHLVILGFSSEIIPTAGHPVVIAERCPHPGKPTVLIYGHYDVQPVEPLDLWVSPPFEPTVRDGKLWARGSSDDKGQLFAHLKAIESIIKENGELSVNIKVLLEGEEEIGSENLGPVLRTHADRLGCDLLVISDTPMVAKDLPSVTLGLRGLTYWELHVRTAGTDLHSGMFGGAVPNAATAACRIMAMLKNDKGRILVPGVYEDVRLLSVEEKESLERLPFSDEAFLASIGATATEGEEGYSTLERLWARPTLDVMGISSGHTGEGAKTVIPAKAMVKFSMRLVPDQEPGKIEAAMRAHLEAIKPAGVDLDLRYLHGGKPYLADSSHPAFRKAFEALRAGFGKEPVFNREGGSIPIVNTMTELFGVPALLIGLGLPDQNAHAPNENFDLDNFFAGIKSFAHFYAMLGEE
jgi:acetylornithine deacetylase/succinyl-diaminopimelate desuccinylase-like protein